MWVRCLPHPGMNNIPATLTMPELKEILEARAASMADGLEGGEAKADGTYEARVNKCFELNLVLELLKVVDRPLPPPSPIRPQEEGS